MRLGFVEEHVLLFGATRFALGSEHLVHHLGQPLFEQVAFNTQDTVLTDQ